MHIFDTKIQMIKHRVLVEVAKAAWSGNLSTAAFEIPKIIKPGKKATTRCCVYKERAIVSERVRIAMGGNSDNPNIIEVIDIACDECPIAGYEVTEFCRGCLAHHCSEICPRGAITHDANHISHIDKSKCVNCGACAKVCPYDAIISRKRPCLSACKVKAISMDADGAALIDNKKCIECGACIYHCPFGAIADKSYITDVIDLLKGSANGENYNTYAIIAPSFASQFRYTTPGKVISGIKALGFKYIDEVALGADMTAKHEAAELSEKQFLTSSCCPAFVRFVEINFPALKKYISDTLSPMAMLAKFIKDNDADAKIVFIGPCTAKKSERNKENVKAYVDSVITFEELQALFESRGIDVDSLDEETLENASPFGRKFAVSGGVSEAVKQALTEQGEDSIDFSPCVCNGIEECRIALLKKNKGILNANFIEGMACVGGCINGSGCLTHSDKNRTDVENHALSSDKKTIDTAVNDAKNRK